MKRTFALILLLLPLWLGAQEKAVYRITYDCDALRDNKARKTYRWNKQTHIDEMSVAEVSRRMTTFRQWTRNEIIALCIWVVVFNAFNYWVMGYHLKSIGTQVVIISAFTAIDILIICILYKKGIYQHLDNIKKNIEELKDICTE